MQRARAIVGNILLMAGSLAVTLLALEMLLRLLPVASAPPVEPPSADNPIQRYVANQPFTWSLGWSSVCSDGNHNSRTRGSKRLRRTPR